MYVSNDFKWIKTLFYYLFKRDYKRNLRRDFTRHKHVEFI